MQTNTYTFEISIEKEMAIKSVKTNNPVFLSVTATPMPRNLFCKFQWNMDYNQYLFSLKKLFPWAYEPEDKK